MEKSEEQIARERSKVILLIVAMISIVMMFSSLISAFIVSKGGIFWVNLNLPSPFWFSTGVILVSSITMNSAFLSIRKDKKKMASIMLAITLAFGITFGAFQYSGWKALFNQGSYFTANIMNQDTGEFYLKGEYGKDFTLTFKGQDLEYRDHKLYYPDGKEINPTEYEMLNNQRNTASSYIYLLSFLHLLHLVGGLIYLIFVIFRALRSQFGKDNYLKIKLISIYWHFLGGLWLFLFLFLQYIH